MAGGTIFHPVRVRAIGPGEACHVEVGGREIALFNLDGTYWATDGICTHMRARLADGYVEGDVVECPLHFGRFEIHTGKAVSAPCTVDLQTYPVRRDADGIAIGLPDG
jgi:naphthalene 1,2-dioxygenase system ferredoxin subunit